MLNERNEKREELILVDENDKEIAQAEKMDAHKGDGKLHRAFSVFIFNSKGQMMLQKRAVGKYHSGSLWTNTCCGHPRPGESNESAAKRRLQEEMGFQIELTEKFSFIYHVALDKGLSEHEYLHVFIGNYENAPNPDPEEVEDWKWVEIEDLKRDIEANPEKYTKWFPLSLPRIIKGL